MNESLIIFSSNNKEILLDNTFTKEKLISYINFFDSEHYLNECTFTSNADYIGFQYGNCHHKNISNKVKANPIITIKNFKPTNIYLKASFTQIDNRFCHFAIGVEVPNKNTVYRILDFTDPNIGVIANDGGFYIKDRTVTVFKIKTNNNIDYTWEYKDDTGLETFIDNSMCNIFIESSLSNTTTNGSQTRSSMPLKIEKLYIKGE